MGVINKTWSTIERYLSYTHKLIINHPTSSHPSPSLIPATLDRFFRSMFSFCSSGSIRSVLYVQIEFRGHSEYFRLQNISVGFLSWFALILFLFHDLRRRFLYSLVLGLLVCLRLLNFCLVILDVVLILDFFIVSRINYLLLQLGLFRNKFELFWIYIFGRKNNYIIFLSSVFTIAKTRVAFFNLLNKTCD